MSPEPARKRWVASQHNFAAEVAVPVRPVELHDLTLRDGEEAADLAFTTADKVRLAETLARLGLKRTEIFLTVPGWQEVIREIMRRDLGLDLWVTWQPGKVERAFELGVRHAMVWYRIGEAFQQHVSKRPEAELFDTMVAQVAAAKAAGGTVNLFMPESTRANIDHITRAAQAAAMRVSPHSPPIIRSHPSMPAAPRKIRIPSSRAASSIGSSTFHARNDLNNSEG